MPNPETQVIDLQREIDNLKKERDFISAEAKAAKHKNSELNRKIVELQTQNGTLREDMEKAETDRIMIKLALCKIMATATALPNMGAIVQGVIQAVCARPIPLAMYDPDGKFESLRSVDDRARFHVEPITVGLKGVRDELMSSVDQICAHVPGMVLNGMGGRTMPEVPLYAWVTGDSEYGEYVRVDEMGQPLTQMEIGEIDNG